ncbi:hypothetical protein [Pseudomonas putida]|uniref:hypothetical protein n=1 Tax=Pseudomonas putida TaxID=303 RepID=UPI004046ED9F
MTQKFIVSVPGRAQPLCIEADTYKPGGFEGDGVSFIKVAEVVAIVPAVDLVAKADCLPAFPDLSQFAAPTSARVELLEGVSIERIAEPVRGLDPEPLNTFVTHNRWGVPVFWPAFAGLMVGLVGGVGLALSHLGVW